MSLDGRARCGEAQATMGFVILWGKRGGGISFGRDPIETIKDALQMLLSNTDSLVGNADASLTIVGFQLQTNNLASGRIGQRVVEQVIQDVLDTQSVADHGRHIGWEIENEFMLRRLLLPAFDQLQEQFGELDLGQAKLLSAGIEAPD